MDDIFLASSDLGLLHEPKQFLYQKFEMKALGEALYVIGIEFYRERLQKVLGLSQKPYIEKVLKRFGIKHCTPMTPTIAPVLKGVKLS